jgi:hypothetical protein
MAGNHLLAVFLRPPGTSGQYAGARGMTRGLDGGSAFTPTESPVSSHPHDTAKVHCPWLGGCEVDIDVQLAPLIRRLWDLTIETNECCEEARPGEACIEFPGTSDVENFLAVAPRSYQVNLETSDGIKDGKRHIRVRLLVYFPTRDIPRLVKVFAAAAGD